MADSDDMHTRIPSRDRDACPVWQILTVGGLISAVILIAVLSIELPSQNDTVQATCHNLTIGPLYQDAYWASFADFGIITPVSEQECESTAVANSASCLTWFSNTPIRLQEECEPGYPCCCVSTNPNQCAGNPLVNDTEFELFSARIVCSGSG